MVGYTHRIIMLLVMLLLAACSDKSAPVLRIGMHVWPGYEPLYLARELGYLDSKKVHLVEYSSQPQTIQFFRNGLIDAAAMTLDQALMLQSTGEHLALVLVMDVSKGADAIIARRGIGTLAELKGKYIGVENITLGFYMLSRALDIAGMKREEVRIKLLNIDEQEAAFKRGEVDAVVTFDPVRTRLLKAGHGVVFDSNQIYWEVVDVLVIKKDFLEKHPTSVRHMLDAWYQALDYFKRQPREAATLLGRRMQLDVDATLQSYQGLALPDREENRQLLTATPEPLLLLTARRMSAVMLHHGIIHQQIEPQPLFDGINSIYVNE